MLTVLTSGQLPVMKGAVCTRKLKCFPPMHVHNFVIKLEELICCQLAAAIPVKKNTHMETFVN